MHIVRSLWEKHSFILSKSFLVVFVSLSANVFSYLFQFFTGRYFSVEEYGQLNSLFSLSGIIPLIVGIFISAVPKMVAEIKDQDYPHRISRLFFTLFYFESIVSVLTLIFLLIFSRSIGDYLNISDINLIKIFSLAVAAGVFTTFMTPFMQGLLRFKAYSFAIFMAAFLKLAVALSVIYFKLNVTSIFAGLAITTLIVGIIGVILLAKNITHRSRAITKVDFTKLIYYSMASSLGLIGLSLIQNIDVIEVKHFFDEATAGIYASTSVIGKMVFYAASPVAIVMLPICSEKYKKGENFIKPFLSSITIALLISSTITAVYVLFPEFVIKLLFGTKYLDVKDFLPQYAFYNLLYTLMYIAALFLISISKFKESSLPIFAAVLQYFGIKMLAHNPSQVIYVSAASVFVVLLPLFFIIYRLYLAHTREDYLHRAVQSEG